jgi:hypothetical protein
LVVDRNVREEFVGLHVLLRVRADQIVKSHAADGEHGLAVEFSVVESVQQMDRARAGSGKADAQLTSNFRVAAGHESSGFLVAYLDKLYLFSMGPERFHNAVDAVARQSKHSLYAPVD